MDNDSPRGTLLNFVITPRTGASFALTVSSSIKGDPGFEAEIFSRSQASFGDAVAQLRAFKDIVEDVDVDDWARAGSALAKLEQIGYLFAYRLFGQRDLERFRDYLPTLFADIDPEERPALIEIAAPEDMYFPLELLPVLAVPPEEPTTADEVIGAARAFPGFATVIRRTALGPPLAQRSMLKMGEKLPVRLFRHGRLESELFDRADSPFEVRGPWPAQRYDRQTEAIKAFGRLIFDAEALGRDGGDQIQHFACHCQTGSGEAGTWEIQLAPSDESDELGLSLTELLLERGKRRTNPSITRPLVFMNACGSAAIDPLSILSLPRLFLENSNCAYIGTETKIPPDVAAAISQRFYAHLLGGERAGIALHRAKWELLLRHGNPSGALYTFYGDPDVAVAPHDQQGIAHE
jgi:hypothetical protein